MGCSPQLYFSYVQVNSSQCKHIVETAMFAGDNCLSEFTSETIEQPSPLHNCCDVCQQKCWREAWKCTAALNLLPEVIETNTATICNEQAQLLDPKKCLQLYTKLCAYKESLFWEATEVPSHFCLGVSNRTYRQFNSKGYCWKWIPAVFHNCFL